MLELIQAIDLLRMIMLPMIILTMIGLLLGTPLLRISMIRES